MLSRICLNLFLLLLVLLSKVASAAEDRYTKGLRLIKELNYAEAATELELGYWDILNGSGSNKDKEERALACMQAALVALGEAKGATAAAEFVNKQAWFAGISGYAQRSTQKFSAGLRTVLKDLPENHHLIGSWYHAVAYIDMMSGEYAQAIEGFRTAATLREEALGITHELVEASINSLAYCYQTKPRQRGDMGPLHMAVRVVIDFGQRLRTQGHEELAVGWFERAEADAVSFRMGALHHIVGYAIIQWGITMRDLGDLKEAQRYIKAYRATRRGSLRRAAWPARNANGGGGGSDYERVLREHIRVLQSNGLDSEGLMLMYAEEGMLQLLAGYPATAVTWLREALQKTPARRVTLSDVFIGQVKIHLAYALGAELSALEGVLAHQRIQEVKDLLNAGIELIQKKNGRDDPDVTDAWTALDDVMAGLALEYMPMATNDAVVEEEKEEKKEVAVVVVAAEVLKEEVVRKEEAVPQEKGHKDDGGKDSGGDAGGDGGGYWHGDGDLDVVIAT